MNRAVHAIISQAEDGGWEKAVGVVISGMQLTPIVQPVAPAAWDAIKAAINKEILSEGRLLDCVAVTEPGVLPAVVHDWEQMIVQIGTRLVATGLPRDEIGAALSAADANAIWHRAAVADEGKLRDNCVHDLDWQTRFNQLDFNGLGDTINKLLPTPPADASLN